MSWACNPKDEAPSAAVATLQHRRSVYVIDIAPDGQYGASGDREGAIKVFNQSSGEEIAVFRVAHAVKSLAFSPDGTVLAVGSSDLDTMQPGTKGGLSLWRIPSGQRVSDLDTNGYAVYDVAFSRTGELLAAGCGDGNVRVWDAPTFSSGTVFRPSRSQAIDVEFSPSEDLLLSTSNDNVARLWNPSSQELVSTFQLPEFPEAHATFSPDGKFIVCVKDYSLRSKISTVVRYNVVDGSRREISIPGDRIYDLRFSPDGKRIAIAFGGNRGMSWRGEARIMKADGFFHEAKLEGHSDVVDTVRFSPDGGILATGTMDGYVKLWDAASGTLLTTIRHGGGVYEIAFSLDGQRLVTGAEDGSVKFWDTSSLRVPQEP